MLTNTIDREIMLKRIEKTVAILMEERPLFREELNQADMNEHLFKLYQKNLPIDEFNSMTDQELKENCSFILSTEMMSGMLKELTPDQLAIFDEAIKRK
jgi:hypothetical protein